MKNTYRNLYKRFT